MVLALVAIAVVGALLIVPQLAHAAGGGSGASGAPALSAKQLSEKWAGHPVPEVPEAELMAIWRRDQHLLNAPPPPGGSEHKVYDFIVIPGEPGGPPPGGSIFVRQKAAERDQDLAQIRNDVARAVAGEVWFPRKGEYRTLTRVDLMAQKDWGFLGTGISGGQLGGLVGTGLGTLFGGPAGGAVGGGLGGRL